MAVYEEFFKLFDYMTENFLPAETLIERLVV
jgi:histone deacetylase complex regulatory component SIN3